LSQYHPRQWMGQSGSSFFHINDESHLRFVQVCSSAQKRIAWSDDV